MQAFLFMREHLMYADFTLFLLCPQALLPAGASPQKGGRKINSCAEGALARGGFPAARFAPLVLGDYR